MSFLEDMDPVRIEAARDPETMSIEALQAYVERLEAEAARIRGVIEGRRSHMSDAESLFRK